MKRHKCEAIGCRVELSELEVLCPKHLVMLESDTRRAIHQTYRPGRRSSKRFLAVLAVAQQEILFLVTNGHRMPRAADFDFDDDAHAGGSHAR